MQGDLQNKKLEVRIKIFGVMVLLASGIWTLFKWRDDRKQEVNRYVFEKQTTLYFEATKIAATIANSEDIAAVSAAKERFNELFYGDLVVVEDRRIELAMIAFLNCANTPTNKQCERPAIRQDGRPLKQGEQEIGAANLQNLSLDLAACVRTALEKNRGILFTNQFNPNTKCPYD
jgi:hypothetical protein